MPNQRASGQILIGCHLDAEFVAAIDKARQGKSRSQFLREVLFWYVTQQCKISLPASMMHAPDRTGKGGRPRKALKPAEGKKRTA
jgi:hypothetical protein